MQMRHWIWGLYTAVCVLDVLAAAVGISTSSWMQVNLNPSPQGRACTLKSPKTDTLMSGILSPSICFGTSQCTRVFILLAVLGYGYVLLKAVALVFAFLEHRHSSFGLSAARAQTAFQFSGFLISAVLVLIWGIYFMPAISGLQFVDWRCGAWSFYCFCGAAGTGVILLIFTTISLIQNDANSEVSKQQPQPQKLLAPPQPQASRNAIRFGRPGYKPAPTSPNE